MHRAVAASHSPSDHPTVLREILHVTEQLCLRFEATAPPPLAQASTQTPAKKKPNRNHIAKKREKHGAVA